MALNVKIEPINDWIEITVNEMLSPTARSKAIAEFARERLKEAQDVNQQVLGRLPAHDTFVDGNRGGQLESVNPDRGIIVFEFELLTDVLRWIGRELVLRSPVRSGAYAKGHTLFADGSEIAIGERMPMADEYSFTNLVPYARKIEIGKTRSGRSFTIQVANRIYERTAKDARARFGNIAKIEFTFRGIVGGAQINPRLAAGSRQHNKSALRFPTIIVRPN